MTFTVKETFLGVKKEMSSRLRPIMKKIKPLWSGETRPYKRRLFVAALSLFSFIFTVFIFGPFEMYQGNQIFFPFYVKNLFLGMGAASLVTLIIGASLIALIKGKFFDITVTLIVALSLGCYIQAGFMNQYIGALDGEKILLGRIIKYPNLLVWFLIFAVSIAIYFFSIKYKRENIWKNAVKFIPIILIGMQLAAFVQLAITVPEKSHSSDIGLSMENQFELSSNKNIVIFLLDSFSGDTIDVLEEKYPGTLDHFSDFTFFRNYSASFGNTFPSVATMLTGSDFDPSNTTEHFFKSIWESPRSKALFDGLKEQNYERRLFFTISYVAGRADNIKDYCDNLTEDEGTVAYGVLIKRILKLSAYRYAPYTIKEKLWMDSSEIDDIGKSLQWGKNNDGQNVTFYQKMLAEGLSVKDDKNVFVYYHLKGNHPPSHNDEWANPVAENYTKSGNYAQAKGTLYIVEQYMKKMKDLGIYDNAVIIVAGDNSNGFYNQSSSDFSERDNRRPSTLMMIKRPGETHEETVINQAPVCHLDFNPTLLQLLEIDHEPYGRSVYDFEENETRLRSWCNWRSDKTKKKEGSRFSYIYQYEFDSHVDAAAESIINGDREPVILDFIDAVN